MYVHETFLCRRQHSMTAIYDLLFTMVLYLQINNRPYFKLLSQKILTNALAGWSDSRKSTSVSNFHCHLSTLFVWRQEAL